MANPYKLQVFGKLGGLPAPETAAVGQVLKVSAVDENGKVTEVTAEDLPTYENLDEVSF